MAMIMLSTHWLNPAVLVLPNNVHADLQMLAVPPPAESGVPRNVEVRFINMATRQDRRNSMENRLTELFASRPPAFASWTWRRLEAVVPTAPELLEAYTDFVRGTMGCTLSHIAALSPEEALTDDVVVIIEDDASFTAPVLKETWARLDSFFTSQLAKDWDVLLLGYEDANLKLKPTEVTGVSRALSAQTTVGYVVHPRFRRTLSEHWRGTLGYYPTSCLGPKYKGGWPFVGCPLAIDQVWKVFMSGLEDAFEHAVLQRKFFAFAPPLVKADVESKSSIWDKNDEREQLVRCTNNHPGAINCGCGDQSPKSNSWATQMVCRALAKNSECYSQCCDCPEMHAAVKKNLEALPPMLQAQINATIEAEFQRKRKAEKYRRCFGVQTGD